jgi:hypothetical protein
MSRDIEMEDAAAVMSQHQEHVEDLEPNRGNCEKIDRHQCLDVVLEEGTPRLRSRLAEPDHVLALGCRGSQAEAPQRRSS